MHCDPDRSNGCDDAGEAPGGHVWVPGEIRLAEKPRLSSRSSALRVCRRLGLQIV